MLESLWHLPFVISDFVKIMFGQIVKPIPKDGEISPEQMQGKDCCHCTCGSYFSINSITVNNTLRYFLTRTHVFMFQHWRVHITISTVIQMHV